jgi:hypothetical protein
VLLAVSAEFLGRRLRHHAQRARIDGRLSEQCAACGGRLKRLGFRYWIEGPPPKTQSAEQRTASELRLRLQGTNFVTLEGPWYAQTKAGAAQWARMRASE